jgi:vacuolar iron transporter family protein
VDRAREPQESSAQQDLSDPNGKSVLTITSPGSQWRRARDFERAWLARHIHEERRTAGLLGEVREAVFGAQDGLVSTLGVVSAIAGFASALAGIFSMSAGEYMSSKSQREIFDAQIATEEVEVDERPAEAEAEVAFLLEEEGLERESALRVASEIASNKRALLKTMVEKELALTPGDTGSPLRGAIVMGGAFGLAALVPILPFVFLTADTAQYVAVAVTLVALFAMGVIKSRWTRRHWLPSGLEIVALGTLAGVAGYLFGSVLPGLLGVAGVAG